MNLTNGEVVNPHDVGDGAKLMELAYSTRGVMTALAVLLASGNGRGSGDIDTIDPLVGSWAGHRVILAGDYDDPGLHCEAFAASLGVEYEPGETPPTLYSFARMKGKNIASRLASCFSSAGEDFGVSPER